MNGPMAAQLAAAIEGLVQRKGSSTPSVRGADWRLGVVTAVGVTAGTVDVGDIRARRLETYQNPQVGDLIRIDQSGNGNWLAVGRATSVSDPGWTQPTLATGFSHNGNSNGNVQYRVVSIAGTRFMQWRGGVGITYASNSIQNSGDILASPLSASLRPAILRTVPVACSASTSSQLALKADARTDGQLRIVGTTTSTSDTYTTPIIRPPWVSLNGVQYPLD